MVCDLTTYIIDITCRQSAAHPALELWRLESRNGEKALLKPSGQGLGQHIGNSSLEGEIRVENIPPAN